MGIREHARYSGSVTIFLLNCHGEKVLPAEMVLPGQKRQKIAAVMVPPYYQSPFRLLIFVVVVDLECAVKTCQPKLSIH